MRSDPDGRLFQPAALRSAEVATCSVFAHQELNRMEAGAPAMLEPALADDRAGPVCLPNWKGTNNGGATYQGVLLPMGRLHDAPTPIVHEKS